MGAYTILTADGGRLDFDRTHSITELRDLPRRRRRPRPTASANRSRGSGARGSGGT